MTLNTERRGSGRPILMVHGLGSSLRSWDRIADELAATRELVLVDLPGHGRSAPLPGRQTIAAHADALARFMADQALETVDTVGSSIGGRLVLELARRGLGGACVALDPGGFWNDAGARYLHTTLAASVRLVRALRPALPALARSKAGRTALLAQLSARPWALPSDLVRSELQSIADTKVFDAMLREVAKGPLQEGTAAPPGKITIGWGRNDRLLLPRQAERAQRAFPTAKLHWFERCGHFPQWDQPAETVRVILEAAG